jgi:predicted DNA-binding transcriptional regulator YafY
LTKTTTDQLRRILHLLPEIADGHPRRLEALAARLGVDRGTLLADLKQLADRYDDPGGFVEGVRIFLGREEVEVSSSHFLRPMRLTLSELRAVELGLVMLVHERPPEEQSAIARARKRLRAAIAKLPEQDLECGWLEAGGTGVDLDVLTQLRGAILERRAVRLEYQSGAATNPAWREVHPFGLIFNGGVWYLVGDGAATWRFFRVDRIHGISVGNTKFVPPAEFSLDFVAIADAPFAFPEHERLVVRYQRKVARWIGEREGRTLEADGGLTANYPIGDAEWAVRYVLQYGPEAQLMDPATVRDSLVGRLASICESPSLSRAP